MEHVLRAGRLELDGAPLAFDVTGEGPAVVLVHAGVADRRMWDPLVPLLATDRTVVRYDLRGFGASPSGPDAFVHHEQLLALLDHLHIGDVDLVGCSFGAFVALSAAVAAPERVRHLVLLSPVLDTVDPTPSVRESWRAEAEALEEGDVDAAVEVNLRAWFDGPRRGPDDVDPELRAWVGQMQADVFSHPDVGEEQELEPGPGERLGEVTAPTTIVTGALDQRWVLDCADALAAGLPRVRLHVVEDVGHLPSVEAPERVAEVVREALAETEA